MSFLRIAGVCSDDRKCLLEKTSMNWAKYKYVFL